MQNTSILLPLCAQVLLTFAVWIWLYVTRLGTMYRDKINPQMLADEAKAQAALKGVVNPSDNFENLFELPVLFYVGTLVIFVTGITDEALVLLAWTFVGFRTLHSLIHCTYNRIMHRFTVYLFASIALWAMWARILIHLLQT